MKVSANGEVLIIGDIEVEFPNEIREYEVCGEIIVVVTDYYTSDIIENVWGVGSDGSIAWQIPRMEVMEYEGKIYTGIVHSYRGISKVSDNIIRVFGKGGYYEIYSSTGEFTKNLIEFRIGKRPW